MGKAAEMFTVDARIVWAAAAAAYRINDCQYVKEPKYENGKQTYETNRSIFNRLLIQPESLLESDYIDGEQCRLYFQQQTFKMLSGEWINPFVREAIPLAELEVFCPDKQRQHMGIMASLPGVALREKKMDEANRKLKFASGYVGNIGERYTININVVKCVFSHQYNTFFVSGLTEKDEAVLFGYKERMDPGTITIDGTVKGHRNNITKLNRVKVR